MSQETVAAFLREAVNNPVLREELVTVARQHGFVFAAAELGELDLRDLSTVLDSLDATTTSPQGGEDDDPTDPGFGIIEVPG
jgi:hypothetical protein